MSLFKKKDRKAGAAQGWTPIPLLGDSTGSPWYAKSPAYNGDPTGASARPAEYRAEPQAEQSAEYPPELAWDAGHDPRTAEAPEPSEDHESPA